MCSLNHWTIREVPRSFSVQTNSSKYKEIRASQVALVVRNLPANAGDLRDAGLIPGLGRAPGGGHGSPLLYSCLENPMDRGAWRAAVHGIAESDTTEQLTLHTVLFFFFFLLKLLLSFYSEKYPEVE